MLSHGSILPHWRDSRHTFNFLPYHAGIFCAAITGGLTQRIRSLQMFSQDIVLHSPGRVDLLNGYERLKLRREGQPDNRAATTTLAFCTLG